MADRPAESGAEGYREEAGHDWLFRFGIAAAVVVSLSIFLSNSYLRRRLYEVFKIGHIVLAIVLLALYQE